MKMGICPGIAVSRVTRSSHQNMAAGTNNVVVLAGLNRIQKLVLLLGVCRFSYDIAEASSADVRKVLKQSKITVGSCHVQQSCLGRSSLVKRGFIGSRRKSLLLGKLVYSNFIPVPAPGRRTEHQAQPTITLPDERDAIQRQDTKTSNSARRPLD